MNIYEHCTRTERIRYDIDLKNRTLNVGKKTVIDNGSFEGDLGVESCPLTEALDRIGHLYECYNHSIPSRTSDRRRRKHFNALSLDELDDDDLLYGTGRERALFELEYTVLALILNGSLIWDEKVLGNGWFWQSPEHPGLVILREWVEPYRPSAF